MKKTFLSFFVLCLTCGFIYSQEVSTGSRHELQFYIINGYAVAYNFPSRGILNYRINADFGAHYGDISGDYTGRDSRTEKGFISRNLSITLTPQIYLYFLSTEYAKMYAGGGAFINYQCSTESTDYSFSSDWGSSSNTHKTNSYSLGLSTLIGIETELAKHILLFAESQINGGKKWTSTKNNSHTSGGMSGWINSNSRIWFADYSNIRIGLGVYF